MARGIPQPARLSFRGKGKGRKEKQKQHSKRKKGNALIKRKEEKKAIKGLN